MKASSLYIYFGCLVTEHDLRVIYIGENVGHKLYCIAKEEIKTFPAIETY